MLQSRPDLPPAETTPLPPVACVVSWATIALDLVVVVTMFRVGGSWDASPLLSVLTLGGHHRLMAGLALAGLLLLAVLAPWTHGFARLRGVQQILLPVAGVLSLSALAGLIVAFALLAGVLVAVALLFGAHTPAWVIVSRRRR